MTYYDISQKTHPEEYGDYDSDNDITKLWLGGLVTPELIWRKVLHEAMHERVDAANQYGKQTTAEQDHFIIDILEAEGYLDVV